MLTQILNDSKINNLSSDFVPSDFIPDLVIYHNVTSSFACPDGLSAAWVCHKKYTSFSYSPTFLGCCYNEEPPNLDNYQNVLVVDFSFSKSVLDYWESLGKTVYVLDHHKAFKQRLETSNGKSYTLSENILKSNKILVNLQESGCTLAWKCLFPDKEMPEFLKYVRDRDLFIKELSFSDEVHAAYGKLRRSFNLYDNLAELDQDMLIEFMKPIGQPSLDAKYLKIAKYMNKIEFWENIPVVTLNKSDIALKSDIGEFICKKHPFSKFCVILGRNLKEVRVRSSLHTWNTDLVSLFSDVEKVGGHSNAANFPWYGNESQTLESLKELILERAKHLECSEALKSVDNVQTIIEAENLKSNIEEDSTGFETVRWLWNAMKAV